MTYNMEVIDELLTSYSLLFDAHCKQQANMQLHIIEEMCLAIRMNYPASHQTKQGIKDLLRTVDHLPVHQRVLPKILLERHGLLEKLLEFNVVVSQDIAYFIIFATHEQLHTISTYVKMDERNERLIMGSLNDIIGLVLASQYPEVAVGELVDRCMFLYAGSLSNYQYKHQLINEIYLTIKYYYGQTPPINFNKIEQTLVSRLYSLNESDNRTIDESYDTTSYDHNGDYYIDTSYDDLTEMYIDPVYKADHTDTFMNYRGG